MPILPPLPDHLQQRVKTLLVCLTATSLVLVTACSADRPDESTPAIRQQLNDVQVDLDAATRAAEDRLREACGEQNTDC